MMTLFLWVFRASVLKKETVCFSKTLTSTNESTRLQNLENNVFRMTYVGECTEM
jgi:hypothetical protein